MEPIVSVLKLTDHFIDGKTPKISFVFSEVDFYCQLWNLIFFTSVKNIFFSRLNYLSTNRELFRLESWGHAFWLCVGGVIDERCVSVV